MFVRPADVLHADADAFYASVEQRDDPRLRGRPVIVGSGVVLTASYEARAYGVRGAMPGGRARRLCPQAVVVQPRFSAYVEASRELFAVFEDTAPHVEGLGLEEAFLDVRGLERISGSPEQIARRLRRTVREQVRLPLSVGVAGSRVLAKLASGAAKPDGLLVVPPGGELDFLHPLAVERVWGVGAATAGRLRAAGIGTVGDAAKLAEAELVALLGRAAGRYVHAVAHNRDTRRVRTRRGRRSVGAQRALRATRSRAALDSTMIALVDRVSRRLRSAGRAGRTVTLRLRFADFARATRSRTLSEATATTGTILAAARELLAAAPEVEERGITLVGITVSGLDGDVEAQLTLAVEHPDPVAVDAAVDGVRGRFGTDAITRATLLGD